MQKKSVRPADKNMKNAEQIIRKHSQMLYKICLVMLGNKCDAEDAVQETFLRYMTKGPDTQEDEHEKAWLITTASNLCRDSLRHWWHRTVGIDDAEASEAPPFSIDETLQKVLDLPANYRTALYLRYYEGYSGAEISRMLHRSESTVRGWLHTGRNLLKLELISEEA